MKYSVTLEPENPQDGNKRTATVIAPSPIKAMDRAAQAFHGGDAYPGAPLDDRGENLLTRRCLLYRHVPDLQGQPQRGEQIGVGPVSITVRPAR